MAGATAVPLVLTGNLMIGATTGVIATDEDAAVDVSSEVTKFTLRANVATVNIPASLSTPKGNRGGAADYSIDIGLMSTDGTTGALFQTLWTALGTNLKTLLFYGSMRDDVVSAANPAWWGIFIVTAVDLGGAAQTVSLSAGTFPLTGPPTQITADI